MDDIDTLNNPQFELLSAYLDHEVSVDERKQVEQWLADDPEFYRLYQQLSQLQRSCQALPSPVPSKPEVEDTVEKVLARIDARRTFPWRSTIAAAAIAAAAGAIAGLWSGGPATQFANTAEEQPDASVVASFDTPPLPVEASLPLPEAVEPSGLMIALEHPPVDLPSTLELTNSTDPN